MVIFNTVRWLGHAACQITTSRGKNILIDPWITGNPACPVKKEEIDKCDIILVTHDHRDHLGTDVPYLVEATGAVVVVQPELADLLKKEGLNNKNIINGIGMNIGGSVTVDGIKITMTQAFHSSSAGSPAGFIVTLEDGKNIYHAGDTGIFSDMAILGRLYNIDLALLPIGSVFVMDPLQAAFSLTMLKPKIAVPIHYRTFPILVQDAGEFEKLARENAPGVEVVVLNPGEKIEI